MGVKMYVAIVDAGANLKAFARTRADFQVKRLRVTYVERHETIVLVQ